MTFSRSQNSLIFIQWMAPESLTQHSYSYKSDVWSYGVTLWEIVTQQDPFPKLTSVQAAVQVVTSQLRLEVPDNAPPSLQKLIEDCFIQDPEQRPSFSNILSNEEYFQ
jgi:serine/threonine protein kinase